MKKLAALTLALLLLALAGAAAAEKPDGGKTLKEGRYIIGEDIEAGAYTLTCTATAGDEMNDAYGSLGSAFDALNGGGYEYGSLFGALGGIAAIYGDMTVEILGSYGDVLRSCSLKAGESMSITLKEETALQIMDGTCTILPEQ